jgi:hypothetical protein
VPAFVIGPRLDYLEMNAHARELYRVCAPAVRLNLPVRLFLHPEGRAMYPDWEASAERTVAKLRVNHGKHLGNASFERLIDRLKSESAAFCALWARHDVHEPSEPVSRAIRRIDGTLYSYNLQSLAIHEGHEQALVVLLPAEPA